MKIPKSEFSEWYNTITKEAELCDLRYGLKGFIVFMPWSVMSMELMYATYEKELQKTGHMPAWFPALIPEANLKRESEHVAGFVPEVLWVTQAGNEKLEEKYAMRPTSETAMYPMYALWINGKGDLPLKIYQRAQVWRHETKATKPFIRSREFYWIEAHDVFATEADAMNQVHEDMETAEKVLHQKWGIPFLFFKRPQWDKFAGADNTFAADMIMPDGKVLQQPSTHMLGQHFAKAFDVKYMDDDGQNKYAWQTCYGPAISRIYAGLIATHGDGRGLILPFELAPLQIVIVPIYRGENKAKLDKYCAQLAKMLSSYRIKVDDSETTPGFKYNKWEMKGVPVRLEIGEREVDQDTVTLVRRDTQKKEPVKQFELLSKLKHVEEDMLQTLRSNADKKFNEWNSDAESLQELAKVLETKGGFVKVPFCTDAMEGKQCAEKIKDETHGNVRGSLFGKHEKPKGKCVVCGKIATIYLYVARQY